MEIEKIKYWINDHPTALKKSAIRANLYKPCKKLFEENAQAALETDYLWKLLAISYKPLYGLICRELINRVPAPFTNEILEHTEKIKLCLIGKISFKHRQEILKMAEKLNIEFCHTLSSEVTHVIVGYRAGRGIAKAQNQGCTLLLPDHLIECLNLTREKSFLGNLDEEEQNNIIQLLKTNDENNQKIALEILKQDYAWPDKLMYQIFAIYLLDKIFISKTTKHALYTLIKGNFYINPNWRFLFIFYIGKRLTDIMSMDADEKWEDLKKYFPQDKNNLKEIAMEILENYPFYRAWNYSLCLHFIKRI